MSVSKMLNKPLAFVKQNQTAVIVGAGLIFLAYYFMYYSKDKSLIIDGASKLDNSAPANVASHGPVGMEDDDGEEYGKVDFHVSDKSANMPSCQKEAVIDAAELLPKPTPMGSNQDWDAGQVNAPVSVLEAGQIIGMASQSLRNANLQVRSEPANPQMDVGPWNQTTITADVTRRPLEIGCGSQ